MTESVPLTTSPLRVRLRVEDYLLLDEAGAFADYGKTELLDGEVFYMNAQHRPHARIKSRLHVLLAAALEGSGFEALIESSVSMPPGDVPEPDIVITSEPEGEGLVPLASVQLLIEIADTTLAQDLGRKMQLYAQNSVPEYWVVDIAGQTIRQMWAPVGNAYAQARDISLGHPIAAVTIPGMEIVTAR